MEKISKDAAFCAMQHINALIWQSANEKQADFAMPCEACPGAIYGDCKLDWESKISQIAELGGEPIHLMKSECLRQVGKYPNSDSLSCGDIQTV